MKNVMASVGLVALGAFAVQNAHAQMSAGTEKPWSVSGTLRGFYDDNYNTAPNSGQRLDSFGFELRPSATVDLSFAQSQLKLSYVMSMKYYDDRPEHKADYSHDFETYFNHNFSERYSVELSDSFVIAQEPDLIDPDNHSLTQRVNGDNIRNTAGINFHAKMTEEFSAIFGYSNTIYDYDQNASDVDPASDEVSRSGQLDRMEQSATATLRWQATPQTAGVIGYQFSAVNYTSDESLGAGLTSAIRNNNAHYIFIGGDHNFSRDLSASIRVGGQYSDYYANPATGSSFSPYVDLSGTYIYMDGGSVLVGFSHKRSQTDLIGNNQQRLTSASNLTQDQESSTFYGSLTQKITPKLTGTITAQYQISEFNSGDVAVNNASDNFILVGLNLAYQFTHYISGEVGYNYDNLTSGLANRGYDRNRVYIGVTASY